MTIMDDHHYAMDLADNADKAKREGRFEDAKKALLEAYKYELAAAMKFFERTSIEPTRSILFRSAASLALECEEYTEAERMVAMALSGTPPPEIADELRDIYEKINFQRHLMLRGVTLNSNELQLSIWGPEIGFGIAQSRDIRERLDKFETVSYRTLERKLDRPFRDSGRPAKEIYDAMGVYESVPRAASFAVTIRLAGKQESFPGFDLGVDVVKEIVDCIELLNDMNVKELAKKIPNEHYYNNFISLMRNMAPDGKRITHVGFTLLNEGKERRVKLEIGRDVIGSLIEKSDKSTESEFVMIEGDLRSANANRKRDGIIELINDEGKCNKIRVPLSMMADIVRPLFDYRVRVTGRKDIKGNIKLVDIIQVNQE